MLHAANGGPDGSGNDGSSGKLRSSPAVAYTSSGGDGGHDKLSFTPKRTRVLCQPHSGGGAGMSRAPVAPAGAACLLSGLPLGLQRAPQLAVGTTAVRAELSNAGGGCADITHSGRVNGSIALGVQSSGLRTPTDAPRHLPFSEPPACEGFVQAGEDGASRCDGGSKTAGDELLMDELLGLFTDDVSEHELAWRSAGGQSVARGEGVMGEGESGRAIAATGMHALMQAAQRQRRHEQHQHQHCGSSMAAGAAVRLPRPLPLSPMASAENVFPDMNAACIAACGVKVTREACGAACCTFVGTRKFSRLTESETMELAASDELASTRALAQDCGSGAPLGTGDCCSALSLSLAQPPPSLSAAHVAPALAGIKVTSTTGSAEAVAADDAVAGKQGPAWQHLVAPPSCAVPAGNAECTSAPLAIERANQGEEHLAILLEGCSLAPPRSCLTRHAITVGTRSMTSYCGHGRTPAGCAIKGSSGPPRAHRTRAAGFCTRSNYSSKMMATTCAAGGKIARH